MSDPEHPMDEEINGLRDVLRSLADEARARARAGPHPTPEKLMALHYHQLSDEEASPLEDHLVGCRPCATTLLDLVALRAPLEEADRCSPEELAAGSAALKAQLGLPPVASREPQAESKPSWGRRFSAFLFPASVRPYGVALAGLLAVSLLVAVWVIASLRSRNRDLLARLNERPGVAEQGDPEARRALLEAEESLREKQRQIDEERARTKQFETRINQLESEAQAAEERLADERRRNRESRPEGVQPPPPPRVIGEPVGLNMIGTIRGAGEDPRAREPRVIEVPEGDSVFTLFIFLPPHESGYSTFAFEVWDQPGTLILERSGLRRATQEGLMLFLKGSQLPAGQYQSKVYGLKRGVKTLIGKRLIEVKNKKRE